MFMSQVHRIGPALSIIVFQQVKAYPTRSASPTTRTFGQATSVRKLLLVGFPASARAQPPPARG